MINEVNGRPYLGPDDTYEKQRKLRFQDAIDDYLLDDQVSSRQIYEEMLSCIDDTLSYYEKNAERVRGLRNLMTGHKECEFK